MKNCLCENKVLKLLDVFLLLAVGLLMVIDWASYSWLPGCNLYSKASALEQIVPCGSDYRNCIVSGCLKQFRSMCKKENLGWPCALTHINTHAGAHSHTYTPLNHSWLVRICDIQHSLVNVCLRSLGRKGTLCECVFTSQLQCCELRFTAARWRFSMWTCAPQRWKYT